MNKLKMITAVAVAAILFTACEKEDPVQLDNKNSIEGKSQLSATNKSGGDELELMMKAANIKSIDLVSSQYSVEFYGSADVYNVEIIEFDPEEIIELNISLLGVSKMVTIDFPDQTLEIEGDGIYNFEEYEDNIISKNTSVYSDLSAIIPIYHSSNPISALSVLDNGDNDIFPVNNDRKWFGRTFSEQPCVLGLTNTFVTYHLFGMSFGPYYNGIGDC